MSLLSFEIISNVVGNGGGIEDDVTSCSMSSLITLSNSFFADALLLLTGVCGGTRPRSSIRFAFGI